MLLYQIWVSAIHGKIYKFNNTINLKYQLTWNAGFELQDRSHTVLNIQEFFDYIIKKHETRTDNPPKNIKYIRS